jgi:hypothetical protein
MGGLLPVKLPPGFFRNGTEYEAAGRWYDGNLVRWRDGRIRPWGGWRRASNTTVLNGAARAIIAWRGNNGFRYCAIGTNSNLYVSSGGNFSDQTPTSLVAGRRDAIEGPGYGAGPYGLGHYGTRRLTSAIALDAASWTFDIWGENLLGVLPSDGRLVQWQPSVGGAAAAVSNAPTGNTAVLVTDEEYVLAIGAGSNKRRVAWCSQGDNTIWTPSATNTAGGLNLKTQGNVVTAAKVGSIILIWTTNDVHNLPYLGTPLIYGTNRLADNCGIISPNAKATDESSAYWMGLNGFFYFDGLVHPLPCDVQDYVFGRLNQAQRSKVFAGRNSQDGEIVWFYPSTNSTENDSYVAYNYFYKIWYFGSLSRTCWADRGTFVNPLAVDGSTIVFEHEIGLLGDGASRNSLIFVQSGPAEIGAGDKIIYSSLMVPDVEQDDALQLRVTAKTAPKGRTTSYGPFSMVANVEGYVPVRISGRQAALRFEQTADKDWSIGTQRFETGLGGGR